MNAHHACRARRSAVVATVALALSFSCYGRTASASADEPVAPAAQSGAVTQRPTLSRDVSVTIYPVSLAGRPVAQVGEVVGMLLERGGMEQIELTQGEFAPITGRSLADTATAFAAQFASDAPSTDYALYCEYLGTPGTSVDEVRTILASRAGAVVWVDGQTKRDHDFATIAPKGPMECCVLVAKRLQPVFQLDDPQRSDAPEGKLATRWKTQTGLPDDTARTAIDARATTLRAVLPKVSLAVFAPHVPATSTSSASDLAARLAEQGVVGAKAAPSTAEVTVRYGMNEQMVLWNFARSFSEFVRKHPPAADYALHADYLFTRNGQGETIVIGVHTVVCDKAGELVFVDFQNRHQADFKFIMPATREDCDRLVAKRVATLIN